MMRSLCTGLLVGGALTLSGMPVRSESIAGVDCSDIRRLTAIERWYWIKRLKLSRADIRAVKARCGIK